MPNTFSNGRGLRLTAALASCLFPASCLEPVQPTPRSTIIAIDPVTPFTRGLDSDVISRFEVNLRFRNDGARTIYLDGGYRRLEKLVDQKWEVAMESPSAPFEAFREIRPGQRVTTSYVVLYDRRTTPELVLLKRIRGLYRMRLRLAFTVNGTEQLHADDSYSQPFAVTE